MSSNNGTEMIGGTFHFHSTYSHDGRNTLSEIAESLRERGFSFCLMTEHFEDFDSAKFERYLQEVKTVSANTGFLLIPGMEVDLSGLHTIVFPVAHYAEITKWASDPQHTGNQFFKVLAHPSKYSFEKVVKHVEAYRINGIELWNQQADGRFIPPIAFLHELTEQPWRHQPRYFFGCDLHSSKLAISNIILIAAATQRTPEAIINALTEGDFLCRNAETGIEYCNGSGRTNFDTWLTSLVNKSYVRGKLLGTVRAVLKPMYRMLPRPMRRSLNDVKNFVRNKV
jgi:PHP domain